jgi:hypothetical protein
MINGRHDDRASWLARQSLKPLLSMETNSRAYYFESGRESGENHTDESARNVESYANSRR